MNIREEFGFDDGVPTESLRKLLLCPGCWHNQLIWSNSGATCGNCGIAFPFHKDIWFPVIPDRSWRGVLQDTVSLFMDFNENRDALLAATGANPQEKLEENQLEHEESRDAQFWSAWVQLNVPTDARILEVAAGDLRVASALKRRGYSPIVLDPIPEILGRGLHDQGLRLPKLCCSAARLPFKSQSFDLVFCQAALHHLYDMQPVVREMFRVARAGGTVAIFAEPYSAIFSDVRKIHRHFRDQSHEIGINETIPRFADYLHAINIVGGERIRAFTRSEDRRIPPRLTGLSRFAPSIFSGPEISTGARMKLRHSLTHGQVCIFSSRTGARIDPPPAMAKSEFIFDQQDYIFNRHRKSMVEMWRRTIPESEVPRKIDHSNAHEELRRGFEVGESDERLLISSGAFFLRSNGATGKLVVEVANLTGGPVRLELFMNGDPVAARELSAGAEWQTLIAEPSFPQSVNEFQIKADRVRAVKIRSVAIK